MEDPTRREFNQAAAGAMFLQSGIWPFDEEESSDGSDSDSGGWLASLFGRDDDEISTYFKPRFDELETLTPDETPALGIVGQTRAELYIWDGEAWTAVPTTGNNPLFQSSALQNLNSAPDSPPSGFRQLFFDNGALKVQTPSGSTSAVGGGGSSGETLTNVASSQVTLSSGTAVVTTGITATDATFSLALGVDDPGADAKVAGRLFWDDSAGAYKIEIVEDGTSVGNPTVNYDILRVR